MLKRFLTDAGGATGSEYAIIATGLSIAIVAGLTMMGDDAVTFFESIGNIFNDWEIGGSGGGTP